ncbi:MAG TPA: PstS family phosphate ABC transporter substrate-binding protein [Polyangiaceae bacterium LLY-WYZ-15_(1-7)]|nr:PstS family phosphate ABC transporter substrate-binding protein [Polyangiaceae bacterium LLY-WYZ-15_(1-7)]HJL07801.1 PstS family phosphate ABC transporter substrate-binding protein [Polyangiaceae bacterium LLY-WYZ-15_(1-7)]HJL22364.1 PstS family phosphate ABC transporter substrate-binding protein [Polyangiaceae bacterium LLY-WYZ-15_(1-7)]HJL37241.1 PstS family phosphate ABC transporter substrate-binding protein [Polyangiaceae bacterium LLY-WYZ-15_(1-7)]
MDARPTLLLASVLALAACGSAEARQARRARTITVRGSDTMVILAQRWAQAYMDAHPGIAIQVSGGGSGTGVAALLNGTTDLANASRELRESEREQLRERRGTEPLVLRVAIDAVAVYVHEDSPIRALDVPTVRRLFRGRVDGWSALGGPDAPIVLYSRENNSGTYAYFKEAVLDRHDFAAEAQSLPGTAAVIHAVSRDLGGIGYGGIGYGEGVRAIAIAPAPGAEAVLPSPEATVSGAYPLARHLQVVLAGPPEGPLADYLRWLLSDAGQAVVEDVGFFPLPGPVRAEELAKLPEAR